MRDAPSTNRIVIRSLNVGGVEDVIDDRGVPYQTAVRRTARADAQYLDERGFAGDASFESEHHTPNMDVHAFSLDRYPHYEALAGRTLTGWVRAGDELLLRERRLPEWTVDRVNRVVFEHMDDDTLFEAMLALPQLSSDWKDRALVLRERFRAAQRRPA